MPLKVEKGIRGGICHSSVPKIIPIVFHNGSNYDYHFIIKELAEEFEQKTLKNT